MILTALFLAAAGAAAAPSQPPKPMTAQQQFDAASTAQAEGRCDDAIKAFQELEKTQAATKNPKVLASIRVRKAMCLAGVGRADAAARNIELAIPVLDPDNPVERTDLALAHIAKGRIAYLAFDYAAATREFETAKPLLPPDKQFDVLVWLTRSTMFDPGLDSVTNADAALAIAKAANVSKDRLADLQTLHARALLNHGRAAEGFAELKKALAAQGGLSLRVGLADIVTRSDLAIAALLVGNTDAARQYLAYTGAGRLEGSPFSRAAQMAPPACGGPADLKPDDFAIVEFLINDDGSVGYASPIYVSRGGAAAATEFARAVSAWSWLPKDAASIPPLFRVATRVELRCSTANERPDVTQLLVGDFQTWFDQQKVQHLPETDNQTQRIAIARSELAKRGATGGIAIVEPLVVIAGNSLASEKESKEAAVRLRDTLYTLSAPVTVRAFFEIRLIDYTISRWQNPGARRDALRKLLAVPEYAANPRVAGTLKLLIAEPVYRENAPSDATELLTATATDPRLPAGDPLKTGAFVRLAGLQAGAGDIAAARQSYAQSGLSAQQCSLVDAQPVMKRNGSGSFPMEAMRWGFEGWVRVEYDIQPDGLTANRRAVIAYPPLVFRDAAVEILKSARFGQSYRPEGGPGCGGALQNVNFNIP